MTFGGRFRTSWSRWLATVLLLVVGVGGAPSIGVAERWEPPPAPEPESRFWRAVRNPGGRRAETLLRHALRQLGRAMRPGDDDYRRAVLAGALARLERAHELVPEDVDVLYFYAFASSQRPNLTTGTAATRAVADAIRLYERLRELAPDYEAETVAFELGILFTRQGNYERAIAEYERGIGRAFDPRTTISAHSNLAEVIMLGGDPERALRYYERAAELARRYQAGNTSLSLSLFGAAVASDRLGEGRAAVEFASEAIRSFGGSMAVLRSAGVFFEPENELHWYEALGHLALSETEPEAERQLIHLRSAERAFRRYLDGVEQPAAWDRVAERHVAEIEAEIARREATAARRRPSRAP